MKPILVWFAALALLVAGARAQAEFSFHVSTMDFGELVNERIEQIVARPNTDGTAGVFFSENLYVSGIKQAEFSYQPVRYSAKLSADAYQEFRMAVAKLDAAALGKETKDSGLFVSGSLRIDGKEFPVKAAADSPERRPWDALFADLRKRFPPAADEQLPPVIFQGDFVEPLEVSLTELLKKPAKFAGKRVRVLGYFHGEFEFSHFSRTKEEHPDYQHAFWLAGFSQFGDFEKTPKINDAFIVIDATFDPHARGHLGLWAGELARVTAVRRATAKEIAQLGVAQPAATPEESESGKAPRQPERQPN